MKKAIPYQAIVVLLLILAGCKTSESPTVDSEFTNNSTEGDSARLLIVNEGLFQRNNSSITYISPKHNTSVTDFYLTKTGLQLGDTGNDIKVFGNKIYIVVNVSSYLAILDKTTFRLIKQISLIDNNIPKQPRQICFYQNKALVSCFDGDVVVIDTNNLTRIQTLKAGRNPDGICISGNYLFVANTGGLSAPNFDKTISVYNLPALTLKRQIEVAANPLGIWAGQDNFVYVYSKPDYSSSTATFCKINGNDSTVIWTKTINKALIGGSRDTILRLENNKLIRMSTTNDQETVQELLETQPIINPYRLFYNASGNEIWISDAKNYTSAGLVYRFNNQGKLLSKYPTGLIPSAMDLLR